MFKIPDSSKRFYQSRFVGIRSRNKTLYSFLKVLLQYLYKKIKQLLRLTNRTVKFIGNFPSLSKDFVVKKLIWSRGKLGRPVTNIVVLLVALFVFFFGEIFNSTEFVVSGEVNPDYLSSVTDIIPNQTTATTLLPEERKRTESFEYTVVSGDTISGIGAKFKISADALKYVNSLTDSSVLKVGQTIVIPPVSGLVHKVEKGDTLDSIAAKYDVPSQAVADFNYILDTSTLSVGTELVIPGAKIPEPVLPVITPTPGLPTSPLAQATPSPNFCVWPTTTRIITQYFAWYHNGLDVATSFGRAMPPIFSCTGGTVIRAGWDPWGLGLHVRVDHGNGYETVYGHMSRIDVGVGQRVGRGEVIGLMGSTGRSTGPHVHFMIKFNGIPQNPLSFAQ